MEDPTADPRRKRLPCLWGSSYGKWAVTQAQGSWDGLIFSGISRFLYKIRAELLLGSLPGPLICNGKTKFKKKKKKFHIALDKQFSWWPCSDPKTIPRLALPSEDLLGRRPKSNLFYLPHLSEPAEESHFPLRPQNGEWQCQQTVTETAAKIAPPARILPASNIRYQPSFTSLSHWASPTPFWASSLSRKLHSIISKVSLPVKKVFLGGVNHPVV